MEKSFSKTRGVKGMNGKALLVVACALILLVVVLMPAPEQIQISNNPVIARLQGTSEGQAQLKFLGIDYKTGRLVSHSLAPLQGDD